MADNSEALKPYQVKPGEVRNKYGRNGNPNKKKSPDDGVDPRILRKRLQAIVDFNLKDNKFQQDLDKLSPRDRVAAIMSLMQYCTPKLMTTQLKGDIDRSIVFPLVVIGNPRDNNINTEHGQ
jgi:hypothetical protein